MKPVPIPPLPAGVEDYTLAHFQDYLKAATLYENAEDPEIVSPKSRKDTPEKILASASVVPAQFFNRNFNLSNPTTFASIFPTETFGPEVETKVT